MYCKWNLLCHTLHFLWPKYYLHKYMYNLQLNNMVEVMYNQNNIYAVINYWLLEDYMNLLDYVL